MTAYGIPPTDIADATVSVDRAQAAVLLALLKRLACTDAQLVAHMAMRPALVEALGVAPTLAVMQRVWKTFPRIRFAA